MSTAPAVQEVSERLSPTHRPLATADAPLSQLALPTGTVPTDPANQGHEHAGEATHEYGQSKDPQQAREEEGRAEAVELGTRVGKQQKAADKLTVDISDADAAPIKAALTADGIAALNPTVLETEWTAERLALLVDLADTDQLLSLLGRLDAKPIADTLSFHHLTYETGGVKYLHDVSGIIQPGQLTGLIGAPDAGITLLLSLLAGRLPLVGKLTGDILFNGAPITSSTHRYVGYVVKEDPNLPQMTVFETLNFSARLRVTGESAKVIRFRTLLWMKVLGLSHTYSTVVGDALTRGVSGGERRRVSFGCEMVAGQSIVLADLPTNGLDSTSAYGLIKNVTTIARTGRAMIVSLVQPSPEILALLDVVTVMGKGKVIYTGKPSEVEPYFNSHGFQRPDNKSLPDWIEEMSGTPERFWTSQIPPRLHAKQRQLSRALSLIEAAKQGKAAEAQSAEDEQQHTVVEEYKEQDDAIPAAAVSPSSNYGSPAGGAAVSPIAAIDPASYGKPILVNPAGTAAELALQAEKAAENELAADMKPKTGLLKGITDKLGLSDVPYIAPDKTLRGQAWLHLTAAWSKSPLCTAVDKQLDNIPRQPAEPLMSQVWNRYATSFPYQLYACLQRQIVLTGRNKGIWLGNIIQSCVMGVIIGTLFFHLSLSQSAMRVRFGLFFFMLMQSGMGTAQMIPVHFQQRSTFYNQRQNGYYSSAAYYLAAYLVQLPIGAMETFLLSMIVYPLSELRDGVGPIWAYMWLVLLLINWVCRAWIMFLVSISPTEAVTQVLQPISMLLFSTMSGFLAPKSSIPAGWRWLYTISFFTYAIRGLSINEQTGLEYECPTTGPCPFATGYEVLGLYDMQGPYSERWTDVRNLVWFFIAFNCGTAFMYVAWQWQHTVVDEPPNFFDDEKAVKKSKSQQLIERAASQARSEHRVDHKAYIEWRDLCYSVPIKNKETGLVEQRMLLNKTFGWAQPNAMIALMGASGAGKSTLMDVLALKKNFKGQEISGTVLVNGVPQDPITFSRIAGYVEQFDSHNEQSTVREAVEVSARLRLPSSTSERELMQKVDRVLAALGLTHLQDLRIGSVAEGGVSPEVRKKVTIAVELIMNPSLLFLDEPTTGLDAPGAFSVMKAVRELAREISVVCTIHQPSAEIVNMFDGLLLMKSGGEVAYFGALTELPTYFAEQRLGIYQDGHNMGDFALASIKQAQKGFDMDGRPVDVAQLYLQSKQGQSVMTRLEAGVVPEVERNSVHVMPESEYPGRLGQLRVLTKRFFMSGYRDTNTFVARWITCLFFAFLVGTLFVQLGHAQVDASNRIAAVFMSVMYCVFSAPVKAPARYAARPVYFREHGSRMYSAFSYWLARLIGDVPTIVAEITSFCLIAYFAAGLTLASHGTHFALFLAVLLVVRVMGLMWNETVTGYFADPAAGTALFAVTVIFCMLFSGFLIQHDSIPRGWIWMYYISFIRYPLSFVSTNELRDIDQFTCDSSQLTAVTDSVCTIPASQNGLSCPIQCGKQLLDQFGIAYSNNDMGEYYGVVCIYAVAFVFLSYCTVRYVNHVKR